MTTRRTYSLAAIVSAILGLYLVVWLHIAPYLGVGAGALTAVTILIVAAAVGDEPEVADAAWRQAAPDLVEREPEAPGAREPAAWPAIREEPVDPERPVTLERPIAP